MATRVLANGLNSNEPILAALESEARLTENDPDILVLGGSASKYRSHLASLRYRLGRRTPFVVFPDDVEVGPLKVPYITYGESAAAHVRLKYIEGCTLIVDTPLGEWRLELECA